MSKKLSGILAGAAGLAAALSLVIGAANATDTLGAAVQVGAEQAVTGEAGSRTLQSNTARRKAREVSGNQTRTDDRTVGSEDRISMESVLARLREEGYTDIREIEREKGGYEVDARGPDGRKVEVFVDGRTGQVYGGDGGKHSRGRDDDHDKDDDHDGDDDDHGKHRGSSHD